MTKTMVKINWVDLYGELLKREIRWYETEKEALKSVEMLKEREGRFVNIAEIKNADYDKYLELKKVEKELEKIKEELKKEF